MDFIFSKTKDWKQVEKDKIQKIFIKTPLNLTLNNNINPYNT